MGVVNKAGALYFATGIDNTGMYRDADETKRIVGSITEQVRRAGMVIGAVFGAQTLAQFGREIINVRGEMQMLEKSFEVLLGGSSGVGAFMQELKQFAVESPLSMTGVANAAQMLSAFGVEAENLIPVIRQLGDISMGNEEKFRSLALAYSQMTSAGKVLSQDLRQMATAGFNPLGEIARTTGRSIQDVTALMDSGKITVNQVTAAFKSATAEGGKFYGMTQKQADGIKGLKAQIEGATQEAFNNLGKQSEKFIEGTYKATISLIENYETIGRAIAGLITTYGAYRAAVVAVTVAESGWSIASMAQYKWLVMVEKAQKLLNMTMLKNPFVAVATAVVGLITVIATFSDRTTIAEKAQKKLNDTLEEAKNRKEALKTKGNELISVINSETASVYQQTKAYRELIALLPGLKGKSIDDIKKMDPVDIGKMLSEKSDQAEKDTIQAQYDERIKNIEGYRKKIKELEGKDERQAGWELKYYNEQLSIAVEETKGLKKQLDEFAQIQKEAFYQENPEAKRKDLQSQRVALLQKEAELTERINDAGNNDLASANDRLALQAIKSQLEANKTALESMGSSTDAAIIKNKDYWKSVLDEATAARDALGTDQVGSDEWKKLTALINSASKQLDVYSTKLKEVKDNSTKLAPRDVGSVGGVGAGIIESFLSSDQIDSVTTKQIGEFSKSIKEKLSSIDLKDVDIFDILTSDLWNKAFSDLDKMAVDDMIKLVHQLELHWKKLKLDPTELAALRERIEKITDEIGNKNPFKGLSEAIRKFKSGDGDFKDIAKNAGASLDQIGSMFNSITDGLVKMGAAGDEESQKMLKGIGEMVGGAATLAKGIATGNPADIIAGSVQLLTAAIDVFDKKSREANRTIKKNTEQVNNLQKAYENLERAISKTYSTKAASLIEDEQRNLEQQRRLIQDNIRAEQSKKKPDNKVINEWKNVLNDIDARLEENKDRILESLTGTDVMSAIDEFAQAYADAWAFGENAAKKSADVVKGILRNALINYMKGKLQPEAEAIMNKIASSMQNDGRIDKAEQSAIDALVSVLDNKAAQYKQAVDPYLDKETKRSGVPGELQAQMTEGTGSQLVGLWNMTAMDTRSTAIDTKAIRQNLENTKMPDVAKELYDMQNELAAINRNTRETADNTGYNKEGFQKMEEKLDLIVKNTKQNNSRG
jgi:tape measure domain-containing protein